MKFNSIFFILILVSIVRFNVSAQNSVTTPTKIIFKRYTTAWVKSVNGYMDVQRKIDTNKELASLKFKGVKLYIPPNPDLIKPNGNKYITAYFVNGTKDSVQVDRADATLSGIRTEIKVGDDWKLLQVNMGSSCGNSYYSMKLAPGDYLSLQIDNSVVGRRKVRYRVIAYADKKQIVSNETYINISDDLIKLAGTPIKPISM